MKKGTVLTSLKRNIKRLYHLYEDLTDNGIMKKNGVLKNAYQGKRCFIVATGASLNKIDLSKLANEHTFGCNFLHKHRYHLPCTFYVAPGRPSEMRRIAKEGHYPFYQYPDDYFESLASYLNGRKSKIFLHRSGIRYFRNKSFVKDHDVFYIKPSYLSMEEASVLSNDLTKRITFLDGSIFFMIATSIYMGFKELYLCGCGYTYQPLQSGHFYEDWTQLDNVPVDRRHQLMKDFAESHEVKIYNVVPNGFESPVYEKITWDHVVENVLVHQSCA